jgi:HSP20 family protein
MELMRYDPKQSLMNLRDDINRIFDMTIPENWGEGLEATQWRPSVDIYEKDDEMIVHAELPGVKKDDISVELKDNVMSIKGKRTSEEEIDEDGYYRKERRFGSFQRSIPLAESIDPDQVKASYKDGVLEVRVPSSNTEKTRRISIE